MNLTRATAKVERLKALLSQADWTLEEMRLCSQKVDEGKTRYKKVDQREKDFMDKQARKKVA